MSAFNFYLAHVGNIPTGCNGPKGTVETENCVYFDMDNLTVDESSTLQQDPVE